MNFKILTFATNQNNFNFKLLQSKLPLTVLDNKDFDWEGKNTTPALLQFLSQLHEEDLVLLTDSYDVLPLNGCNYETLKNKILTSFDLTKVTFNAETVCWPDENIKSLYPETQSKWKYLNAGIFTGLVKNVKKVFEILIKQNIEINQRNYTDIFLNTNLIKLDYCCEVFQTLLTELYNPTPVINMKDFSFDETARTIKNKTFNTTPLLFHGQGKVNLSPLLPYVKTISK